MKTKLIGMYLIFLFIAITAYWIITLSGKAYPEGPVEITFHVVSELLMAAICLIGGVLLLLKHAMGIKLSIAGLSMIIYSVLNAAGYFGERGDWIMVAIFMALLLITSFALSLQVFRLSH